MLLAFAPFIAFAVLNHFVTPTVALVIAALVSLGLIGREILPGRSTIQYARESVPKKLWGGPQFLRTNQIITLVWLAAFAIIIVADLVLLYLPDVPHKVSVLMTIGALYGAFKFTTATQTGQKQKPLDS
jgi:sterol desaturase/sphingolipid hydroxylase (fatty acid hydroxylase superfamily)